MKPGCRSTETGCRSTKTGCRSMKISCGRMEPGFGSMETGVGAQRLGEGVKALLLSHREKHILSRRCLGEGGQTTELQTGPRGVAEPGQGRSCYSRNRHGRQNSENFPAQVIVMSTLGTHP